MKKIATLNDFAKTDAVAKAKDGSKFFVVSEAEITGKDKDGNLILNKNADVAVIRKEDLAESGYGEDGGVEDGADQSVGDTSTWPEAEEAKSHVQALDKCRGMIMKGANLADEDVYGDPAGEGEQNDMDEALKALDAGDLKKAQELRKSALAKRATRTSNSGAITKADVKAIVTEVVADLAKSLGAQTGKTEVMPRKGAGEVVEKKADASDGAVSDGTPEGDLKKMASDLRTQVAALKQERTSFLEKASNKMALSPEEELRKSKVSKEIMVAETALAEFIKDAARRGVQV